MGVVLCNHEVIILMSVSCLENKGHMLKSVLNGGRECFAIPHC